jgi:uncharacterized membrane protein YfcA
MIFEATFMSGLGLVFLAFGAEFIDSSLGMGYGTTLTPLLMLMGFTPLQIVPTILLSELLSGLLAAFLHHAAGNVDFKIKSTSKKLSYIIEKVKQNGVIKSFKKGFSLDFRVSLFLGLLSIIGAVAAVLLALNIPKLWLKIYIAVLITAIGLKILVSMHKKTKFSWKKITLIGILASFNKGMSGGGYGPLVTGGQLLSGVKPKKAIAITSFAEGLTCLVGVLAFLILNSAIDWSLAPFMILGAMLSVPFSVLAVKRFRSKNLTRIIGLVVLGLGLMNIIKLVF